MRRFRGLTVACALMAFLAIALSRPSRAEAELKLQAPVWAKSDQSSKSGRSSARTSKVRRSNWEAIALAGGSYGGPNVFQGVWTTVRLRYLNRVPFALEAGVSFPEGLVFTLMTDAWRSRNLRIHLLDLGVLYLVGEPHGFVRRDVKRRWDLVLGAGAEWQFHPKWWLTADLRFYLPDPTEVPFRYGGFSLPIYADAAQNFQVLIGIGRRLW